MTTFHSTLISAAAVALSLQLAPAQTPANPNANGAAKQVYHFLSTYKNEPGKCLILGQNLGWSFEQFEPFVEDLHAQTGQWLGLVGGQMRNAPGEIDIPQLVQLYKEWFEAGGLVEMSMLPDNPWTGGSAWDLAATDIWKLTTPGQPGYDQWKAELDYFASILAQLRDAGVVVLWRPIVEMNGDWFWWGWHGDDDPQPFIDLWRDMFDYFTYTKQLDNLLWVYAANWDYGAIPSVDHFYPGDDVVDVTGLDIYQNGLDIPLSNYQTMVALGKPFAITEFGPTHENMDGSHDYMTYVNKILNSFAQTTYALAWHDWPDHKVAWVSNQNYQAVMNTPCILTRDELHDLVLETENPAGQEASASVFPNPAAGSAVLKLPEGMEVKSLRLTDLAGRRRELSRSQGQVGECRLFWSSLPPGAYLLRVEVGGAFFFEKLIVLF